MYVGGIPVPGLLLDKKIAIMAGCAFHHLWLGEPAVVIPGRKVLAFLICAHTIPRLRFLMSSAWGYP